MRKFAVAVGVLQTVLTLTSVPTDRSDSRANVAEGSQSTPAPSFEYEVLPGLHPVGLSIPLQISSRWHDPWAAIDMGASSIRSGTDGASRAIANGTGRSAEQTAAACSPGALTGRWRRSGVRSHFRLTGESGSPRSPQLPTTGRMLSRSTRSDGVFARAYADGAFGDAEHTARLSAIDGQVRAATAACAPSYEEAAALFSSAIWYSRCYCVS